MIKTISVVVSVYNEELSLPHFYDEASEVLENCDADYEILFVDDGSTDGSGEILEKLSSEHSNVKVIEFVRNFGHEAAMIAGIDYASGDCVICMDADLQHPPAVIPDIVRKFEEGYEVVSMIRTKNADAGFVKRLMSGMFYRTLNLFSPVKFDNNSSDFFAVSRKVADVLRRDYREKVRYMRGYVQSLGFERAALDFEASPRAAGKSKYTFRKLLAFSIRTLCSFSDLPLKLGIYTGITVAFIGLIVMIYSICQRAFYDTPAEYSTIIAALCFLFAVTLIVLGIIGEYISILFIEVKNRPIYMVRATKNLIRIKEHSSIC